MKYPAVGAEARGQFAAQHVIVPDGHQGGGRDLFLQHGLAAHRGAVGIRDEQDDRRDAAPRRFLDESDFLGHLEELVERVKTEIDHLGDPVIDDQAVHQRHFSVGVVDLGGLGDIREIIEQRRFFQIDVECDDLAVFQQQEFGQLPRDQRLAHQRAGRADDVDKRLAHRPISTSVLNPKFAGPRCRTPGELQIQRTLEIHGSSVGLVQKFSG